MKAIRVGLSLCLILCFLLVASISALGQKVAIDWDRNAIFTNTGPTPGPSA